jgi:membrane associated rhomboid family serine protease
MTSTPVGMRCPECASQKTKVNVGVGGGRGNEATATYALLALNVIAFLAGALGGSAGAGSEMNLDGGICANAIGDGGFCGIDRSFIVSDGGEVWRIISGAFLHAGPLHLMFNMVGLYVLGTLIEPAIGTRRFLGIYFASLFAGSFGALLLSDPNQVTVGASGAVFGLMAAAFVIARHRGVEEVASQIGLFVVLNLFITFAIPGISVGGHLGGLIAGALSALLITYGERRVGRNSTLIEVGGIALITVASIVGALVVAAGSSTGLPT